MQNWTSLIPARVRAAIYIGFGILSLAQTSVLAYCAAVQVAAPLWAVGGGAVLGVIGAAFGFVAAGNTSVGNKHDDLDLDHDDVEVEDPDTGETETIVGKLGQ